MSARILLLPMLLAGCEGGTYRSIIRYCTTTEQAVADVTDWAGPSEEDVLAVAEANAPTVAFWDEHTLGEEYATLSATLSRTADPATITTDHPEEGFGYDNRCRAGRELRLPVQLTLSLDGGEAVSTLSGAVSAPEIPAAERTFDWGQQFTIYLDDGFWDPAELSGDLAAAAYAEMEAQEGDPDPTFKVSIQGTWEEAEIDVSAEGETSDSDYSATLWRGHWNRMEF